ncbi:Krueppel homolog 1 [Gryllus bimaculatus]|nr:Krueppel homolog 1 [Gryllus bimaculatus]
MGSIDSLNDLANALEVFFKGLSECGFLNSYSVQLQVATVDFVVQIKFHCLMYQFMKTLQALLSRTNIPGHESYLDVGVQTPSDFNSVFIEVKQSDVNEHHVSDQLGSLVEACVFEKSGDAIDWADPEASENMKADQNATFVVQSNGNGTSTDIIVTCHPATLAAITGENIVASTESIIQETDEKKLALPCDSVDNFRNSPVNTQEIITVDSVADRDLPICERTKNLNICKERFIEVNNSETLVVQSEGGNEIKSLNTDMNPLILKTYIEEETVLNDNLSVMHIVVASDNSDKPSVNVKTEKEKRKPFKCKDCDKSFTTTQSLEVHSSRKHVAKEQCDMCPRSFSSIQSLQEHCRLEHGGMGCFNCLLCNRRFMTKLSYKRHMDTHVGKKEAVCDMCGKTFSRADYLNKHYMTHSGARPLSCSQCPRKFISSSHLKNHEKTHTGEREHLCKICPKSFSRADKLKEHTLRHLNIKRFHCTVCKRTYAEKRDLTKHMRAHEK